MKYDPEQHHRQSTRLSGYDYDRPGAYFVTICTHERRCLFGDIVNVEMVLNKNGEIVIAEWQRSAEIRSEIELDIFQVMPNHLHAIIVIVETEEVESIETAVGATDRSPLRMRPRSISSLMAGFKSSVTSKINQLRNTPGVPVWKRDFYDRIIRNDDELRRIREYIYYNPAKWDDDRDNPKNWE